MPDPAWRYARTAESARSRARRTKIARAISFRDPAARRHLLRAQDLHADAEGGFQVDSADAVLARKSRPDAAVDATAGAREREGPLVAAGPLVGPQVVEGAVRENPDRIAAAQVGDRCPTWAAAMRSGFSRTGTLNYLRTYKGAGGYKRTFTFTRAGGGINCSIRTQGPWNLEIPRRPRGDPELEAGVFELPGLEMRSHAQRCLFDERGCVRPSVRIATQDQAPPPSPEEATHDAARGGAGLAGRNRRPMAAPHAAGRDV